MQKLFLGIACSMLISLPAQSSPTSGFRGIYNTAPATSWTNAFLSGNGQSGVMIWGEPLDEKTTFNSHKFILPVAEDFLPDMTPVLESARDTMLDGNLLLGWTNYCAYATTNGLSSGGQSLHTGFNMKIQHTTNGVVQNYNHICNYETGEVIVRWTDNRGSWERKTFVSRDEDMIVTLLTQPSGAKLDCTISLEAAPGHKMNAYPYQVLNSTTSSNFRCKYNIVDTKQGGYEGVTRIIRTGGTSVLSNDLIQISGADSVLLLTKMERYKDDFNGWTNEVLQAELNQINQTYDQLLAAHVAIHGEIFNRARLNLNAPQVDRDLPAATLVSNQYARTSELDLALVEKVFDTSRYLFMCSSGPTHGPRLSGLYWGDWSGVYFKSYFYVNVNYTLQIGGGNIANLAECMEGVFSLLERTKPEWQTAASKLFGCRGIVGPALMDGEKAFAPLNYKVAHTAGTGYGPWLVYSMYEHYQITGDTVFLENRVYPFLHDMAIFYEDYLSRTNASGDVIFVPSTSPECAPLEHLDKCTVAINSTFDIAACKHGLKMAIEAANTLGLEQGAGQGVARWTALLARLPDYWKEPDGTLKEWAWNLGENYGHRHTSHGYTVWPSYEINPEDPVTSNLVSAVRLALDKRNRPDNMPQAHGNLMTMYGEIRVKRGDQVGARLLGLFTNKHFYDNIATSHNENLGYFNFDFINSIQGHLIESIVLTQPGLLELLPAVPPRFATGSLTGIKGRNRCTIQDITWDQGKQSVVCTFTSDITQNLKLIYRKGIHSVSCSAPISGTGIYRDISVTAGVPVTVSINALAAAESLLTVNSGSGDGLVAAGSNVVITADAAPSGQLFDSWVINSGHATIADTNASTTTLTMSTNAVVVTAMYKLDPTIPVFFSYSGVTGTNWETAGNWSFATAWGGPYTATASLPKSIDDVTLGLVNLTLSSERTLDEYRIGDSTAFPAGAGSLTLASGSTLHTRIGTIAYNRSGTVTIDAGAALNHSGLLTVSYRSAATVHVYGTMNVGTDLRLQFSGSYARAYPSVIHVYTGGVIDIGGVLKIGGDDGSAEYTGLNGTVNILNGGVVKADGWDLRKGAHVVISSGGLLQIEGNQVTAANGYITSGYLTSSVPLSISYDAGLNETFIRVDVPSGYAQWAFTNSVGAAMADDDSDGRENLLEYAIGGDPNAGGDSTDPVIVPTGSTFGYSYQQRNDDPSLTYFLQGCIDLMSPAWSNVNTIVITNSTVGEYDNVTRPVPLNDSSLYLRLQVTSP